MNHKRTGLDEAMDRLAKTSEAALALYNDIPWWNVKQRFIAVGALSTLDLMIRMVQELQEKWDNCNGRLN